jgi:DNA modification methylase
MNQLILGDCLEVMRQMQSETVDLIYLDPPFFSNRNYEVIWGDKAEVLLDRTGTQTNKFKPGYHTIAVKAIDHEGLEAIEVIKLKINGEITIS